MKRLIGAILAGGMLFAGAGLASAGKPVTVWEDPAGDADVGQGLGQSIPAGFDIVSGSIVKNGANLEFTVAHADMPPIGSLPEAARFLWTFQVGADTYRLTVKSADIGKPDVVQGQTTERVGRADVAGHFRLEGDCARDSTLPVGQINCKPLEYLDGSFDAAAKSFTVIVPMASVGAKVGSKIMGGAGDAAAICQICWVSHYAERSLNATLIDQAGQTGTYKVPKK